MNCILCGADGATALVVPVSELQTQVCDTCRSGIEAAPEDGPHWQCLHDAIWSGDAGGQILAWRVLHRLDTLWARELLEIAYLEPDVLAQAEAGLVDAGIPDVVHRDSNGAVLAQGDTVVLIKDLVVKGGGFTAKRGTSVRGISLVSDNAMQIEGRVDGQRIVLLTQFVKKS
ncbi:alkylphosphonate utilization protein [Puniceibacterium sp. IMCC21224]|uniref:alkylphosphonate utilization protein n=1 Tax=Puniceibacterium sp. IMCC21224 TaxID=1618204 RepID=UPI00064D7BE3|nr:alkylphosphonate utilization protein [Puniceibacterium sp. IMCC21224]KMK66742.1 PhnA protein [Puniceibacterium sp. IMCC21224]